MSVILQLYTVLSSLVGKREDFESGQLLDKLWKSGNVLGRCNHMQIAVKEGKIIIYKQWEEIPSAAC